MATLDLEENNVENLGQCTKIETQSEQEIECSQLISHLSQVHAPHQERNDVKLKSEPLWEMNFDGSCTKRNAGARVWIHNAKIDYAESHAYNLHFKCTNNIVEYEALILGLNLLRKLGARRIIAHGDSEMIIKQVKGEYTARHPRLRAYRNDTMDLLKTFVEYDLVFVPMSQNIIANGLA